MTLSRPRILLVDDQPENLLIVRDFLVDEYDVLTASDGEQALALARKEPVDLVLLDVVMPGLDGFEVCRRLKADPVTQHVPVLFLTSLDRVDEETQGFALGAADFIHKPFSPPVVLARVQTHLSLAAARRRLQARNEDLAREVSERTQEVIRQKQEVINAQGATISAFCALAEVRDDETGNHIRRTQEYVRALAEYLRNHPRFRKELSDENIAWLYRSAALHDVGKVAIPDAILHKPGKLTPDEWEIMKRHTEYGRNAIAQAQNEAASGSGFLHYGREIAYSHHEKWDGSGYPLGLKGDAIPISARLMAVADVFDALISVRCYKPAFPHEKAMLLIAQGRGQHFDPDVADAALALSTEFLDISQRFSDVGRAVSDNPDV